MADGFDYSYSWSGCANGWNAYGVRELQGQLYATMKGYGRATVKYRDCYGQGFIGLYLNGIKIDNTPKKTTQLRTYRCSASMSLHVSSLSQTRNNFLLPPAPRSFDFKNYDVVMFKDESGSIINVQSITYQCTGTACDMQFS